MENSEIKKQDKSKILKTHHWAEANHRAEPITADDVRRYRQRYFGFLESELHEPSVFEYIERAPAGLPEGRLSAATEVAVATRNLIRGLDEITEPGNLWRPNSCGDGFDRALPEEKRILRVRQ